MHYISMLYIHIRNSGTWKSVRVCVCGVCGVCVCVCVRGVCMCMCVCVCVRCVLPAYVPMADGGLRFLVNTLTETEE